ncbi:MULTISPECIES: hypothetical protein [unclassified Rhodococcus (in: high G+C Gram-positive bacteria)]|uniref:hypothetical protein n=1 Tax=unclassified Rhodococcus (in: high G+C Gram-positive bacteria) TaxID=192944 RepID=UPI0006F32F39|nr:MULTISPECIES: hypothetical protein [unclassified Rhodococcus (in: high G+C Gram-positive bacteria)]KQU30357.1 hypothetical protein ASG69_04685 [Rhodococcus sp. Leaf225]KQU44738.1 hypothetical protein ASH03_12455 [Rhodococcus sp. Leaf258]
MDVVTLGIAAAQAKKKYARRGDQYRSITQREPSLVSTVHPSPPTVYTYPQASNPIANPVSWYPQAGGIELLGCIPSVPNGTTYPTTNVINGKTADAEKMAWGPGFTLFGNQVAIRWRSAVVNAYQHVEVDGRLLTLDPVLPVGPDGQPFAVTANTYYVTVLTFAQVGAYRIKFLGRRWGIRDVLVAPTGAIAPLNEKRLKVACVTASFGAGGAGVNSELDGWPWGFGRALGVDIAQASIPGSGLLASVPYGDPSRTVPLFQYYPDALALELAGNDLDSFTPQQIADALTAYLALLNTSLPGVPVVVFGMPPRNAAFSSNATLKAAAPILRAAAMAAPNVIGYHDYVDTDSTVTTYTAGASYAVGAKALYLGSVVTCRVPVASAPAVLDSAYWSYASHYTGTGVALDKTVATVATTSGSATITTASGALNDNDLGATVTGAGIPAGTTLVSRTNATTAVLSAAATATASGVSAVFSKLKGDGNRDVLVFADGTHPTVLGQKGLAMLYARDFRADLVGIGLGA